MTQQQRQLLKVIEGGGRRPIVTGETWGKTGDGGDIFWGETHEGVKRTV